jgi:antitoxin HicB
MRYPLTLKADRNGMVIARAAAKLAIYEAMREAGLTQAALAGRLGCDPRQVRRLLDLDHHSRLDTALAALGKRLVIEVQDAA